MSCKIHNENKTKQNRDKPPGNPVSLVFKTNTDSRLTRNTQLDIGSSLQDFDVDKTTSMSVKLVRPAKGAHKKQTLSSVAFFGGRHWDTT